MNKLILTLAGAGLLLGAMATQAAPEDDRMKLVKHFKDKYPDIKMDDYVFGALAFDPDAKSQYDSIMEFPPYVGELEKGQKLWNTQFKNGKTYADCLPNGGKMIAGNYPMFDEAKGKVVTFEDAINACRVANGEEAFKYDDKKTMGLVTAYGRTLSDGMKMNIKVEGAGAMKAFEDGKQTYYARAGQLNFSCANCHVDNAGNRLRSELLSPVLGQAVHWPVFRGGENLVTLQNCYEGCFKQVRHVPDMPGSTRFNNLEYFHSYLSNGLEMKASVFRK
ncbi:MAG TPA: sulfur oxidation c-type cytochrome SoxA [Thiobacillaceae bacterium]|nr:sulfur oxidation c-type cytochrome SoxA [Thiobacillaceae bacterium]